MLRTNRQCSALHIAITIFSICQFTPVLSNQNAFTLQLSSMFSSFAEPLSTGLQNFKQEPSFAAAWSEYRKLPTSYQFGIGTAASLATLAAGWKAGNSFRDRLDPVGAAQRAQTSYDVGKFTTAIGRMNPEDISKTISSCKTDDALALVAKMYSHDLTLAQTLSILFHQTVLSKCLINHVKTIKDSLTKRPAFNPTHLLGEYIKTNLYYNKKEIQALVRILNADPFTAQPGYESIFEQFLKNDYIKNNSHNTPDNDLEIDDLYDTFNAFFANHRNKADRTRLRREKLLAYAQDNDFMSLLTTHAIMQGNFHRLCAKYLTLEERLGLNLPYETEEEEYPDSE